jgi:hypothetical protein
MEKRMKSRIGLWVVCFLLASVFLLPQAAHAQCSLPPASLASFSGTFQFNVAGIFAPPFFPAPFGEGVIAGILVADGAGGLTTQQTFFDYALFPGALVPAPTIFGVTPVQPQEPVNIGATHAGSYQMNCDGTMKLILHDDLIGLYEYQAVLVHGGTEFYMIDSNNTLGVIASGEGAMIP